MEIKILGQKMRVEVIVICFLLGYILGGHLLCSCSKITFKEGMQLMGAPVGWKMGADVPGSWENRNQDAPADPDNIYQSLEGNSAPNPIDMLNAGKLDMLGDNRFSPTCCMTSKYSNSLGCACETVEQAEYLNARGGNRTFASEF